MRNLLILNCWILLKRKKKKKEKEKKINTLDSLFAPNNRTSSEIKEISQDFRVYFSCIVCTHNEYTCAISRQTRSRRTPKTIDLFRGRATKGPSSEARRGERGGEGNRDDNCCSTTVRVFLAILRRGTRISTFQRDPTSSPAILYVICPSGCAKFSKWAGQRS